MRTAIVALAGALLLAGCVEDDPAPAGNGADPASRAIDAPWWVPGEWWDVRLSGSEVPTQTVRLVMYWNDSDTSHFWLGVRDRSVALDHALHDVNPLLGRVHWGLLTPHEKGIHAHGLYTFPTMPGEKFGGIAFGREWEIEAGQGAKAGGLSFSGRSAAGDTISYDYDPDLRWFSHVDVKDRAGKQLLKIEVLGHGEGEKGTFHFHRGLDLYLGPQAEGPHDERFEVKKNSDTMPVKFLAVELIGRADGPLRIDFLDPGGVGRKDYTFTPGQSIDEVIEIQDPPLGEWTLRYVGTGGFAGTIEVVGVEDYARSV